MTSSSAVNRHRERFVRSNNNLRVSKKLATASRGHHHGVEIVVISSLTSCSSCSSSSDHKLVEGCNAGGCNGSVNLPPISSKTSGGGCNNRLTTRLQHPPSTNQQQLQVQTYSTRYHRSKSATSNDRRLPYSSPTTFGERKHGNKSKKDVTMVGDSMTSSSDNNKLHTLSPNSFSASWPNTKGSSCKTTTITSSYTSSGKTSGLPSYKDESDVIITKHKQPTTTPRTTRTTTTKSGKSSTTKKQRLPRKTATGKKTTKNNNENKSPEVNPATEQPEVVGDVTADDVTVTVSDGLEYYDDLEDRCRRWIADVARERLEHPDKIFLPHLLLP